MKEFLSLILVAMKIGKGHFFKNQWKMLQEEKWFIKNMNITDANYHWKNWVDWILDTWWDKNFAKESKKLKNITILHFITTLYNLALKIGIGFELQGYLNVNDKC